MSVLSGAFCVTRNISRLLISKTHTRIFENNTQSYLYILLCISYLDSYCGCRFVDLRHFQDMALLYTSACHTRACAVAIRLHTIRCNAPIRSSYSKLRQLKDIDVTSFQKPTLDGSCNLRQQCICGIFRATEYIYSLRNDPTISYSLSTQNINRQRSSPAFMLLYCWETGGIRERDQSQQRKIWGSVVERVRENPRSSAQLARDDWWEDLFEDDCIIRLW